MIPTQKKGKVLPWRGRSNLTNLDKDVKRPIDQWQAKNNASMTFNVGMGYKKIQSIESTDT